MRRSKIKVFYPVLIKKYDDMYLVYVLDLDAKTQGHDLYEAIEMAKDIIGLNLMDFDDEGKAYPNPSNAEAAAKLAAENADENLDFTDGTFFLKFIDTETIN